MNLCYFWNWIFLSYNDDGTWSGPYFHWSKARGTGQSYGNQYAFFYDDWNGKDEPNCYVNMCADDPCNGKILIWIWKNIIKIFYKKALNAKTLGMVKLLGTSVTSQKCLFFSLVENKASLHHINFIDLVFKRLMAKLKGSGIKLILSIYRLLFHEMLSFLWYPKKNIWSMCMGQISWRLGSSKQMLRWAFYWATYLLCGDTWRTIVNQYIRRWRSIQARNMRTRTNEYWLQQFRPTHFLWSTSRWCSFLWREKLLFVQWIYWRIQDVF